MTNEELISGDKERKNETFHAITDNNAGLIKKMVDKYWISGTTKDDIKSIILTEMWKAFLKFDASSGKKFNTLFGKYVSMYFSREIKRNSRMKRTAEIVHLDTPINGGRGGDSTLTMWDVVEESYYFDKYFLNIDSSPIQKVVDRVIPMLNDNQRTVFKMRYVNGERPVDIATHLGTSKKVVNNTETRIKKLMRKVMTEIGVEDELSELMYG